MLPGWTGKVHEGFSPVAVMMRALAGAIEDCGSMRTRPSERALGTESIAETPR